MEISFVEIQKIIELLKSKDETNRQLGTVMLEEFGILKEFQDDIIVYLAQIPNFKKQRKHKILENITKSTFNFQSNSRTTYAHRQSKLFPNYNGVINIIDFPLIELTQKILKRLKGKTLQMRYGYFIRHKKLFQQYPSIEIKISEEDFIVKYSQSTKISLMTWLDRGIFQGKYLTAIINSRIHFFPRNFPKELKLYPDLQIVYFLDFKLKKIPHSILICESLEYLVISTVKDKIKIGPKLATHPNLKGIFFEHKRNFHDRIERKKIFYLSIKDFISLDNYTLNLMDTNFYTPLNQLEKTIILESQKIAKRFKTYRTYKEDVFSNYHFELPIPLFEDVVIENKLMSNEQIERILIQLENKQFTTSNVQNSLHPYNQLITPRRSNTAQVSRNIQKPETVVKLAPVDTKEEEESFNFVEKLVKLLLYLLMLGILLNLEYVLGL